MPLLLPSTDPQSPEKETFFLLLYSVYYKHTRKNTSSHIPQQQSPAFSVTPLQVSLLLLSTIFAVLPLIYQLKEDEQSTISTNIFQTVFEKASGNTTVHEQLLELSTTRQWPTKEPRVRAFLQLHPKGNLSWF